MNTRGRTALGTRDAVGQDANDAGRENALVLFARLGAELNANPGAIRREP
jgi:hypothetical protein